MMRKKNKPKQKPLAKLSGTTLGGLPFLKKEFVDVFLYKDRIEFLVHTGLFKKEHQQFVLRIEKVQDIQRVNTNGKNIRITTTQAGITTEKSTATYFGGSEDILIFTYADGNINSCTNILIGLDALTFTHKFIKEFKKLKPQNTGPIEL